MKTSIVFSLRLCISAAVGLSVAAVAVPSPVTIAQAQQQASQSNVIVIMRDQLGGVSLAGRQLTARASAITASQSGVIGRLQRNRSRQVTSFSTINAFATSVSSDEVSTLVADPSVQAVVPDREIRLPRRVDAIRTAATTGKAASAAASTSGLCGTLEPEALQLTNTASLDTTVATAQTVTDGNGLPVTGTGVKVAFIADGIDPNNAGFIRPNGSHVFVDYQDFSGDPAGTPTAGGEAFGDASSIAAQDTPNGKLLTYDISKFVNAAHPLPSPCLIHIRGMAPGASLVGLKVFSQISTTTTSFFVQAIEYAVSHGVDVLNESFGGNPFPDNDNDPISLADTAAVQAGVTVTVSTGDAASMGTLGSPGTNTDVIAAGASTQFRSYAQTAYGVQPLATGYVSNNISALSSGGFSQSGARTVDVVAPGDLGWALCSTNETLFQDCTDYETVAQPTPVQDFGGTSEAAPLTAGEAALVIQAYRSTHGGKSPTPAVVKQIIMSTATDLNAPTSEQGAGLINALGAVHLALSYDDANGAPKAHGNTLLSGTTSVNLVASANTHETQTFTITNRGAGSRTLSAALQTLGAPIAGATVNVTLSPSTNPTFINPTGAPRSYVKKTFTVPAGADHLDAAIGWQESLTSSATPIVYISLLDPSGRQAAYSIPQGLGSGYGHVDIGKPTAGTWTAVIWTRPSGVGSYAGPVQFTWAAEKFVSMGTVTPAKLTLAPGASGSFKADFFTPSEPGDLAAGLRFTETDGTYTLPQIPVTMRTLIPLGPTGGSFSGTLTGGNGRPGAGPTQTYEFTVPNNVQNMSLVLPISDNNYLLEGLLIDPNGMQLSVGLNLDPFGAPQYALQLSHYNPQPGLWKFILLQNFYASGNQTSLPFTARIGFNNAQITATGLPDSASTVLSASGAPVTATIQVINTGAITTAYFADARLTSQSFIQIAEQPCSATTTLPGACGLFYFPTQTSAVQFRALSTVPIQMDDYNDVGFNVGGTGNPDIFGNQKASGEVVASLAEPEVPYGLWVSNPALIGPYGAAGAPTEPVTLTAYATINNFDSAVAADSGDAWADQTLGTATYNPLILPSGEGGTITLTITPDPTQVGKTVTGYVYVDTYNQYAGTGDEVVRIPYSYTVGK